MNRRPFDTRRTFLIALFGATSLVTTVAATDRSIAPNSTAEAIRRAGPALVKLYGAGLGREHGYGTGILVSADGRIVTARELMIEGRELRAFLADGREFSARVLRTDDYRQLALLKIDATALPHLKPATTDELRQGDAVVAMGNWFKVADGDEQMSVTRGVLSLKTHLNARRLTQEFEYTGPALIYDAMTSNPGAPGGALVDLRGRLIGVIGRIVESADTNTRLNYAIPAEEVAAFLGDKPGTEPRSDDRDAADEAKPAGEPYLGIQISRVGYREVAAYVARVRPGSPAATAGIQADDLVLGVNNRRITDADNFEEVSAKLRPGEVVRIAVKRGNEVRMFEVTVETKP